MTINFTIFVQAIHFFLAYLIITRFFIKPALDIVLQEEQDDRELLVQLNLHTKKFEEKNRNKLALWQKSLIKFSFYKSDIEKTNTKVFIDWPALSISKFDDFSIASLKRDATKFLKDKISHVE